MKLKSILAGSIAMMILASTVPSLATDKVQIGFSTDTAYPESVTWSAAQNRFFVGSITHGNVGTVSGDGTYQVFIEDDKLVSTVGVLVDDATDTIWVANSDPGAGIRTKGENQGKLAGIATYDAKTGKAKAYHDLGRLSEGSHFANDVALDADGNAYVTDSFAPLIYRIDTAGKASIFASNPLFHDADGFNLNGIAVHKDGYLLVGKYNSGDLFRVNMADPTQVERVELPEPLVGADGFNLLDAEHLVVVLNMGADKTIELTSTDGWNSASVVREVKSIGSMPTAATKAGDDVWVLNSRLDTLFDPKAEKIGDYLLQKF